MLSFIQRKKKERGRGVTTELKQNVWGLILAPGRLYDLGYVLFSLCSEYETNRFGCKLGLQGSFSKGLRQRNKQGQLLLRSELEAVLDYRRLRLRKQKPNQKQINR